MQHFMYFNALVTPWYLFNCKDFAVNCCYGTSQPSDAAEYDSDLALYIRGDLYIIDGMKSHWDNIVAETARDSKTRRGSEDQSEISVYSDLAGNIFNDLAPPNDDDSGNDADNAEMSVRITIEEEENEDDEEEIKGIKGGAKGNNDDGDDDADENADDEQDDDDDDRNIGETGDEDDEGDNDDDADGEDEGEEDEEENDEGDVGEQAEGEGEENDEIEAENGDEDEDPSEMYDDPSESYDQSDEDRTGEEQESRKMYFDDLENKISQRSRKSSICSSTQTQTETSSRRRWYNFFVHIVSYYPIFIIFITLLNWSFYLGGIIAMNPKPNITLTEPLSPDLSSFPFMTVDLWPSCDSRHDHWRLISAQFAHQGIKHIGGYTALGLIYGVILESTHPFGSLLTAVVYQAAVIFGCLGHAFISPFDGLIGCSTGIYGLVGCSISHILINDDKLDSRVYVGLWLVLGIQGAFEIVSYFIWYSTATAYAAHFTSFFIGLFIGISFGIIEPKLWKRVLGALGISAFCILSISLIVQYSSNLLGQLSYQLFTGHSCCKKLFRMVGPNLSLSEARDQFTCEAVSTLMKR